MTGDDHEIRMFAGAPIWLFSFAKELRAKPSPAEEHLWKYLSKNQCCGLRFRRQHPLLYFIADFYCHEIKLVVEVDGDIHLIPEQFQYDESRTQELVAKGITVIRFTNEAILNETKFVMAIITETVQKLLLQKKQTAPPT